VLSSLAGAAAAAAASGPIDRLALVSRHHPVLRGFDTGAPLSVGNGELAFTADATGLQTFAEAYDATIPLGTLAQWGWHTAPNPNGWSITASASPSSTPTVARSATRTSPATSAPDRVAAAHRLHLGRIGAAQAADGRRATREDLMTSSRS
jgi:hypothetical protein